MKTVAIPGGQARFREKPEIKVRHRRMVEAAAIAAAPALSKLPGDVDSLETLNMSELGLSRSEAQSLYDLQETTIVASLIDWTLPEPTPDEETIGDLDPKLYDALAQATREIGVAIVDEVDFEPSDPKTPGFESTPTAPSAGFAADLRADRALALTDTSPSSGPSTNSAEPSLA